MGHQINFFLGPNDHAELEMRLREAGELVVLHVRSPTPEPRQVDNTNFTEDGKQWLFLYLVRPDDLSAVRTREVAAQRYWSVDDLRSPVIELTRCYYNGKILRRGRLYFVDGYYGAEDQWVEKPEEFKAWANRLFAAARKTLTFDKNLGAHIGPEAEQMRLDGEVEFKSL
jgi:hypothetical protein